MRLRASVGRQRRASVQGVRRPEYGNSQCARPQAARDGIKFILHVRPSRHLRGLRHAVHLEPSLLQRTPGLPLEAKIASQQCRIVC